MYLYNVPFAHRQAHKGQGHGRPIQTDFVCVWTSVTKRTQEICNSAALQLIDRFRGCFVHSCRGARPSVANLVQRS